jgi:site-specific DNA-cytosine methylase
MPSLPHLTGLNCPGAQMMGVLAKDAVAGVADESGCLTPWDAQSKRVFSSKGGEHTLGAAANSGQQEQSVLTYEWHNQDARIKPVEVASSLSLNAEGREGHIVLHGDATMLRNREGKPGGGKGPLLSEGKRLTLGTTNDQVVFTRQRTDEFADGKGVVSTISARDYKSASDDITGNVGIPRRLMPVETEALMGWPRNHTALGIDEQGREYALSDTARYKLCGNGIGSPVTAWIGMRLKLALDTPQPLD